MKDWLETIDDYLKMTRRDILTSSGRISHKQAIEKAHAEYDKYKNRLDDTLSPVEKDFIENIGMLEQMTDVPQGQEWVIEMVNNILIEVLGTIAEQERATIHKRQAEGIESAKKAGKHLGRPVTIKPENWEEVIKLWEKGSISAKEAMNRTGVKKSTFYKLCKA